MESQSNTLIQEVAGTLLFLVVVLWAAYQLIKKPIPGEDDEDHDIHLGI